MRDWNCKAIISTGPDLIITRDTPKLGWDRALGTQKIQDHWKAEEKNLHINVLELNEGLFAQRTFVQNLKNVHMHLKMYNQTAVAYIHKIWGYQQCSDYVNNLGDLAILPGLGNFPFSRIPVWQLEQRG